MGCIGAFSRHTLRRLQGCIASVLGLTLVASAWGQGSPPPSPTRSSQPIVLAMIEGLSGGFSLTGESVYRNLQWAVERVNARGGVRLPSGARPLALQRYDSKGQVEEALLLLKAAQDDGARIVLQGNSSAVALALAQAIEKHNTRTPHRRMLFLNYSAVDPALTNEHCSFWHFRFDAHADMRMAALMQVISQDTSLRRVYLIGQDYSFGQAVLREARRQLHTQRPDIEIVGEELHAMTKIRDFLPYMTKINASKAQAVITGNWGNDLTLLVKAARESGFTGTFYTFYGNALGAPAAMGEAGVGKVVAVADWMPNMPDPNSKRFYEAFRKRFPRPEDDYVHMRMQLMIEALVQAMERSQSTEPQPLALALENQQTQAFGRTVRMRGADHQLQQPLVVGIMERKGRPGVAFDVEGSGYGFRIIHRLSALQAEQPWTCTMQRP